jgi:hypothetical protein
MNRCFEIDRSNKIYNKDRKIPISCVSSSYKYKDLKGNVKDGDLAAHIVRKPK